MLSGVKFIPRDNIDAAKDEELNDSKKGSSSRSSSKKEKSRRKKNEGSGKIKKSSRKKKWYSSDECSASSSDEEEMSESSSGGNRKSRSKKKNRDRDSSKKSKRRREYSSGSDSSGSSESDEDGRRRRRKGKKKVGKDDDDGVDTSNGAGGADSNRDKIDIVRKEMGLEWMLRPADRAANKVVEPAVVELPEEPPSEKKVNPKELNPYFRDDGSGYPEDEDPDKPPSGDKLLSSSLVGDGGASWRLKALKRAKEQAEREGRNLEEVVEDRWGSVGNLAVSVASQRAAAPRAHLRAINSRKMGESKSDAGAVSEKGAGKESSREYLKDVSVRHPDMKAPKVRDSFSWGKRKGLNVHHKDAALVASAISSINKFESDGSFMKEFINKEDRAGSAADASTAKSEEIQESQLSAVTKLTEEKQPLNANQLAAKAMQLRLKGKHEEAEKLLKEAENAKGQQDKGERLMKLRNDASASRYIAQDMSMRQKEKEDDSDINLAQSIVKNKLYSTSTQADDEYDYDGAPAKRGKKRGAGSEKRSDGRQNMKRVVTQQERCVFCFENPKRPKHLVVSIANFTYLMLPQFQPVAPGHCYITTLQHESATRMVDDNVWGEIRNFKKCLIMMFSKQDKEMIFLETVMGLAQQRRHCLIECIPLPQELAKEAPLYFKKAIDEAEDEWSQHNAKKLIDTSQKGLRASIPTNFPYFHVEFGLNKGFVHVIDDETQFKSSLGLNVIRGMLQSHEEDMYRRRRYDTVDAQTQAVAAFAKDWEPFDWTKQLD